MFAHAEFKPFWPVIFLLPWFAVGTLYLLKAALDSRTSKRVRQLVNASGLVAAARRIPRVLGTARASHIDRPSYLASYEEAHR